jgi:serine/threonine protein kinase
VNGDYLPVEIVLMQRVGQVEGVVHLFEYFENEQEFVLVMERPEPVEDMFDYITHNGPLPETKCRDFFSQLVKTLLSVYNAGVIHRDIKNENILVNLQTGRIKLIDFGSGAYVQNSPFKHFSGMLIVHINSIMC